MPGQADPLRMPRREILIVRPLNVAILGLAHLHPRTYMPHFEATPATTVVAASDASEPLREACRTIVTPTVDGIREVLRKVDPEYRAVLRRNILLAGGGSQLRGLDQTLEKELKACGGGSVRKVYDSAFAGAAGALRLAMAMPSEKWEHIKSLGELAPVA